MTRFLRIVNLCLLVITPILVGTLFVAALREAQAASTNTCPFEINTAPDAVCPPNSALVETRTNYRACSTVVYTAGMGGVGCCPYYIYEAKCYYTVYEPPGVGTGVQYALLRLIGTVGTSGIPNKVCKDAVCITPTPGPGGGD